MMAGTDKKLETVVHQFEPVYNQDSRVLLLGTIPSPKSREQGFYYGHPRNRFWRVIADICSEPVPATIEEKKALALRRHIAVWDVLKSCEIHGADDTSIRSPQANRMEVILDHAPIQAIFTTGTKAHSLYQKYCFPITGREAVLLPSTSPANCRMSYEQLREQYLVILKYL